ncbi:hypothetical protein FGW37_28645 [Streptomyces rectiverticillatus]|uniref:hypothetical protein n=1 Tax=Streptomyces rectiverticillatus TaxID=173860 RepID=UPI0015C35E41|nr:hypothetical protein FGW37_28645 [Streptomyces rectiverticillatus]
MTRWEPVPATAFGTAGGPVLAGFLGRALVRALVRATGTAAFSVPGPRSARRAARLDVLRAVAAE